jgi:hypothetical protein
MDERWREEFGAAVQQQRTNQVAGHAMLGVSL